MIPKNSPLHSAVDRNRPDLVKFLIENGADKTLKTSILVSKEEYKTLRGEFTPLEMAIYHKFYDIAEILDPDFTKSGNKMNLEYLQNSHTFHVERIVDFLSNSLPLCALHQTRTIIFFCYVFAIIIEFLLYPPYSIGNTPFDSSAIMAPIIIVIILHVILSIFYTFGALFERATWKTALALLHLLHAPIPMVLLIAGLIINTNTQKDAIYGFSVSLTIAVFLDFLFGVSSRPSQVIELSFEILALFPSLLLFVLYQDQSFTQVWVPFIPLFGFFFFYFLFLLFLSPMCKPCNGCTVSMLSDPEIAAEFAASVDPLLKPFKNRADWADEPDALGSDHGSREPRSRWSRTHDSEYVTRFPARARFQLYNVDAAPENPLYLASPLPMFSFLVATTLFFIQTVSPLANFYFWLVGVILFVVFSLLMNSRSTACGCMACTNLDEKCIDVLWDHPSLSVL